MSYVENSDGGMEMDPDEGKDYGEEDPPTPEDLADPDCELCNGTGIYYRCNKHGGKFKIECDCKDEVERKPKGMSDYYFQHWIRGVSPKDFY
jgi:hypothetical protein